MERRLVESDEVLFSPEPGHTSKQCDAETQDQNTHLFVATGADVALKNHGVIRL
jgi:hypothetical protein